jgi:2-C-methyl-D-erythritol 4-phosphate cytidylyltransferase
MKNKVIKAIILAGGYSRRMKLNTPKQMLKLNNKPLLLYTLDVFERCRAIDDIVLVVHRNLATRCRRLIKRYGYKKIEQLTVGGSTRQQSVFNGLKDIGDCDYVVVHDGVRPFVNQDIIIDVLKAAKRYGAATSAVRAVNTIAQERDGLISRILAREKIWQVQTPQGFKSDLILRAHRAARKSKIFNASDDAQLVLRLNKQVKPVAGSHRNIKITTKSDLALAKRIKEK